MKALDLKSRTEGAMIGLAVGDALGAPVEFGYSSRDIISLGERLEEFRDTVLGPAGTWTDDTSMTLCLADSLIEKDKYNSVDVMTRYYNWMAKGYRTPDGKPAADVGVQTQRALTDFRREGIVPAKKSDSVGNGCIMRIAPIVIFNLEKPLEEVLEIAKKSCIDTHNSIGAIASTELMAAALYLIFKGEEKTKILEQAIQSVKEPELKGFLDRDDHLHNRIFDKTGDSLRDLGGYAIDCFDIAMWGLLNFADFEHGLLGVIRLGGDTDTNGAVFGQLAGAYYGYESIPEKWRDKVCLADEIKEIANNLSKEKK